MELEIKYDNNSVEKLSYPNDEFHLEKCARSHIDGHTNQKLNIGDSVDCQFQDDEYKQGWSRGWVANIDHARNSCDIIYYDNCYEQYIPTNKVRLITPCDASGKWMIGKPAFFLDPTRKGSVLSSQNEHQYCQILFSDNNSTDLVGYDEVARAVFRNVWKDCPPQKQFIWPGAELTMAERAKLRRRTKSNHKAMQSHLSPKPKKKVTKGKLTAKSKGLRIPKKKARSVQ